MKLRIWRKWEGYIQYLPRFRHRNLPPWCSRYAISIFRETLLQKMKFLLPCQPSKQARLQTPNSHKKLLNTIRKSRDNPRKQMYTARHINLKSMQHLPHPLYVVYSRSFLSILVKSLAPAGTGVFLKTTLISLPRVAIILPNNHLILPLYLPTSLLMRAKTRLKSL